MGKQKELIKKIKEKDPSDIKKYAKPAVFFKSIENYYKDMQESIANPDNFYSNTITTYKQCDKPNRKPDHISDSGSMYWYRKDGVIRGSNHWGNGVANCDWAYQYKNGKTIYGYTYRCYRVFREYKYGFSKWSDFIYKAELIDIEDNEVVTSFANSVGYNLIKYKNNVYQKDIIINYKKV